MGFQFDGRSRLEAGVDGIAAALLPPALHSAPTCISPSNFGCTPVDAGRQRHLTIRCVCSAQTNIYRTAQISDGASSVPSLTSFLLQVRMIRCCCTDRTETYFAVELCKKYKLARSPN
jgi:hypothetical protein